MKRYLQCAEQQESASNFSKYCACHEKWLSWSILFTHETLFTMRGVTSVIVQTHQILRLPRKMNLMIDPCHTWNAIYNARRNKCHCPNSPNTAPATQNESHDWSLSHMKRYLQCAEQQVSLSKLTKYCACLEKWIPWLIAVTHETLFTMRGGTSVIVQTHQILRLPRKMNLMIDPCHTWNAIYNARSNKCHCPNSPNTAPATKNESHDWSLSHMKRYLQCAEQQVSSSKLTKYCACHAKWLSKILQKFLENSWNVISNAGPIREWSENDPTMKPSLRNPPRNRGYFSRPPLKNTTFRAPATIPNFTEYCACHEKWHFNFTKYCACHAKWLSWLILVTHETLFTMRGGTSVIVQTHQILRLPRKMNLMIDPHHTWNAIYNARSNKCHCPNSPNTAPATQNDSPKVCKNFSKTAETSFPMRDRSEHDPRPIRPWNRQSATRLATEVTFHASHEHFVLKNTTFRAPAIIPPNSAPATKSDTWTSANRAITWLSYEFIELLLDWAMTWLSYDLTELWLDWAMTWLSYDLTELWLDWAMTWLSYDLTELWLDWAITWLSYDLTELWLDWAMTWLSYYLTELWLRSHSYIGSFSSKLPLIIQFAISLHSTLCINRGGLSTPFRHW